ncbi:MAG TPA: sulfatase-like hydrolase/transferase [Spirochaetota bacterium]|nr:sulfatase-like hydrolase/transferase [Spirochaetota bacterium]
MSYPKKPNILHIFTDQQRADTVNALGNPVMHTPNLDRLCREGTAFTNAYAASPVCVASRCSMIHSLYPHQTGYYANCCSQPELKVEQKDSFMHGLTRAGYRTHGIGKCHFYPDLYALRGFQSREYEEGHCSLDQPDDYTRYLKQNFDYQHIDNPYGTGSEMYYIPQLATVPAAKHPTRWIGDRSVRFIREQQNDQPWYLFTSFIHPHPPFTPPSPWHRLYHGYDMPLPRLPADYETLLTYVNRAQNRYKGRDAGQDKNLVRLIKAYYYACISFIDQQVGRMLKALEQNNQLDNTLIVFTSDHGEMLGDLNSWGKRSMHDASARIPLLARLPGVFPADQQCATAVSLMDLAPTFLNLGRSKLNTHTAEGKDLLQTLNSPDKNRFVFSHYAYTAPVNLTNSRNIIKYPRTERKKEIAATSTYMAVNEDWKYFYSAPDNREFLFDRKLDPDENRNRYGIVNYNDQVSRLKHILQRHLLDGGLNEGIVNNDWKKFPKLETDTNPDAGFIEQGVRTPWFDPEIPGYTD